MDLPNFKRLGISDLLAGGEIPADDLSVDWVIDNIFLVGSPQTVAQKMRHLSGKVGGFGTLITFAHEYHKDAEAYRRSIELLGTVVSPMVADLMPTE